MKRTSTAVFLGLFVVTGLLTSCSQDPYPPDKVFVAKKPAPRPLPVPPLVIDAPLVMEFEEGKAATYEVHASVPAPGQPVLSVSDLPTGATFSNDFKLTWNPPYGIVQDKDNPSAVTKSFPVTFKLFDSGNPLVIVQRKAVLLVHDMPQSFTLDTPVTSQMTEGQTFTQTIKVNSVDFPAGPFQVISPDLPKGATFLPDRRDPDAVHHHLHTGLPRRDTPGRLGWKGFLQEVSIHRHGIRGKKPAGIEDDLPGPFTIRGSTP